MKTGIYKILNTKSGKFYIGSSIDIDIRYYQHLWLLKRGRHHSNHLQNAWDKHGEEAFVLIVLEECDKEKLTDRENYYLNSLLKSEEYINGDSEYFTRNGYNVSPLAERIQQTKDTKLKMLRSLGFGKIYKINTGGKILDVFDMITEIDDPPYRVSLSIKNRGRCLRDKDYGYIREEHYTEGFCAHALEPWNKGRKIGYRGKTKKIFVYDIYNRKVAIFRSLKECAKRFNVDPSNICSKIGKSRTRLSGKGLSKYYIFSHVELEKTIDMIKPSNIGDIEIYTVFDEFIGYSSVSEVKKLLNTNGKVISNVLSGKRQQLKGYKLTRRKDIV